MRRGCAGGHLPCNGADLPDGGACGDVCRHVFCHTKSPSVKTGGDLQGVSHLLEFLLGSGNIRLLGGLGLIPSLCVHGFEDLELILTDLQEGVVEHGAKTAVAQFHDFGADIAHQRLFLIEGHMVCAEWIVEILYGLKDYDMAEHYLIERGWLKVTTTFMWGLYLADKPYFEMTQAQMDSLYDWCRIHKRQFPEKVFIREVY